jgi:hypothetical protein
MAAYQIVCIIKPHATSTIDHISHVGILPTRVVITVEDAIRRIESGSDTFYTQDSQGNIAHVGVVKATLYKRKHIRTYADGKWTDNLLALSQCPV